MTFDAVEEQAELDSFPAAAKAAILKKIADGKITLAETVKKGSTLNYEAACMTKVGKKRKYWLLLKAWREVTCGYLCH